MFVKKVKNRSGSTTVIIIDKSRGNYKVVETIGTSKDEKEISKYIKQGKELLESNFGNQQSLFLEKEDDSDFILVSEISNTDINVVGPELIFGNLFDKIGFNKIPEKLFRHITIARLVYPTSKLKTVEYLYRYEGKEYSIDSIYRFLDRMSSKYKDGVEEISFNHTKKVLGQISVVFYDVTTLYFEAEDEDDLRKIGFSKDGKFQCPQILVGLLVGCDGYPIGYEIFEGNKFEGHTLIPVLEAFMVKYDLSKPIVIADAGLLSNTNIKILEKYNYKYIIGARIKSESEDIKKEILSKSNIKVNGLSFCIEKDIGKKLVISYSDKRASKDTYNRNKGLRRLRKQINSGTLTKESINNRGYNKFLKIKERVEVIIDEVKVREDEKWDGLKGYITNTDLSLDEVINNYKHLWQIEKAFRISKTDLRIRPVYHYKRRRIEAHICISFVAYSIYKELERLLKNNNVEISIKKAKELTQTMYQIKYKKNKNEIKKLLKMDKEQETIYKLIIENI
jgi:transposase